MYYRIQKNSIKRILDDEQEWIVFKVAFWDTQADYLALKPPLYEDTLMNNLLTPVSGRQRRRIHPTLPRRHQWLTTKGKWKDKARFEEDLTDPQLNLLIDTDTIARDEPEPIDPPKVIHDHVKHFIANHMNLITDRTKSSHSAELDSKPETHTKPDSIINMVLDGNG